MDIMKHYDSTDDVLAHKDKVKFWMREFAVQLESRAKIHDNSKLEAPEKEMFDIWTPELKRREFGGDEYKQALAEMGKGLKHHYENNRHHPEHYENGIEGMTIVDIIEMICDWMAAAETKGVPIDMDYLANRFNISNQLTKIIVNTTGDFIR